MKFDKVILFLKKAISSVINKILTLYSTVKNSEALKNVKESTRKVFLTTQEKTSQYIQKVCSSPYYKKLKEFYFSLPQRIKNLLNTIRQLLIRVFHEVKNSKLFRNIASFLKSTVIPFCKDTGNKLKKFFKNIAPFTKSTVIPFCKDTGNKLKCFFKNIASFSKSTVIPFCKDTGNKLKYFFNNLVRQIRTNVISKPLIFIPVLTIISIFLIVFILQQTLFARYYWEGKDEKKFTVVQGKTLSEVTVELSEQDIIQSPVIFKLLAKFTGNEGSIIARHYIFENGMSNLELLELLTDINISQTIKFTVIEGLTIKEIAKNVEKKFFLSSEKFIKETENDSLLNILGLKDSVSNLEGFLFPDTYIVPLNINEKYLVETMFDEFFKRVMNNDEIKSRISEENINILKVVTLASIIQAETPLKKEKPVVSGVYHNRLKKRMRLEADPTVQYILPNGPKERLLYSDLKIESPYNTYLNFGLPPGPINNPGFSAIDAALNPESHNYLFFVANGKGGHKFSETYGEHLRAVQEYRNNRRKQNNNN